MGRKTQERETIYDISTISIVSIVCYDLFKKIKSTLQRGLWMGVLEFQISLVKISVISQLQELKLQPVSRLSANYGDLRSQLLVVIG